MSSDKDMTCEQIVNLTSLPDIPLFAIASYLSCRDLLSLSQSCKNVQTILDENSQVWIKALNREVPESTEAFKRMAKHILERETSTTPGNSSKLALLLHLRTNHNWTSPEAIQITAHPREADPNNVLFAKNYSDHFVVLKTCYTETDRGCKIDLRIYDVRNGRTIELTANTSCKVGESPFVAFYNSSLVLHSKVNCVAFGYRINLDNSTLEEKWKHIRPYSAEGFWQLEVWENFIVMHVTEVHETCPVVMVEGFSIEDGTNIFSHTHIGERCDDRHCHDEEGVTCWSDTAGWFVLYACKQVFAANLKENLPVKRIQSLNPDIFKQVVLRQGKLLCYSPQTHTAQLVDLHSDTKLKDSQITLGGEARSRITVDFDPQNDQITAYLKDGPGQRIVLQVESGPVSAIGISPMVSEVDTYMMAKGVAILECTMAPIDWKDMASVVNAFEGNAPNGSYSLKLHDRSGGKGITLAEGESPGDAINGLISLVKFQRVTPFMIAFQFKKLVVVCDFLKIASLSSALNVKT